jgi:maltose alpha-D-glucosyltransferase/alpha-amylase
MHLALAGGDGVRDFAPDTIAPADVERWRAGSLASLERGLTRLRASLRAPGRRAARMEELARVVLEDEARLRATIEGLEILVSGTVVKTRHHGDYHLGQVLETDDGWVILDFEGEPLRPLAERRALHTPLRDVAGLLRSLDYARHAAVRDAVTADRQTDTIGRAEDAALPKLAATWARLARRAFLDAYLAEARRGGARFLPQTDAALTRALDALEGEKALYELEYELGNRPDWVEIPLAALAAHANSSP